MMKWNGKCEGNCGIAYSLYQLNPWCSSHPNIQLKKKDFVDKISSVPVKPPMLQRWTAETHMRRWNFNSADPDSNNRDVSRWNRDVSPFQLQFCDCLNHNLCNLDSELCCINPLNPWNLLQKFKHKSTKNMSELRQRMPSPTLPKKIHRTEIRKYPPTNPPKNLENNPPENILQLYPKNQSGHSRNFHHFSGKRCPASQKSRKVTAVRARRSNAELAQ